MNYKNILALTIVIIVLILLFFRSCNNKADKDLTIQSGEKTVVVKLVTKIDTVFKKKYVLVHDTIKVPTLVKADTVFIKGTKNIATIPAIKREYRGELSPVDSIKIKYTANTTGTLDKIVLSYEDRRAEKTIIRTNNIETTITNNIKPSGVYVGIGANLGLNSLTPSVEYLNNKNKFGVYYNVAGTQTSLQNVGITYSRKLF